MSAIPCQLRALPQLIFHHWLFKASGDVPAGLADVHFPAGARNAVNSRLAEGRSVDLPGGASLEGCPGLRLRLMDRSIALLWYQFPSRVQRRWFTYVPRNR